VYSYRSIDESVRTLIYRNQSKDFFILYKRNHPKEKMTFMNHIIKQEIPSEDSLKKKLDFICQFNIIPRSEIKNIAK